jgi:imidazolonepropionase-like amidohydrolase
MSVIRFWTVLAAALASLIVGAHLTARAQKSPSNAFLVRDVRLFDGERMRPRASVLVRDGVIAAVGFNLRVPAGTAVIDGRGRTLLPGLIDAHVHYLAPRNLQQAIAFGVTTVLDMGTDPSQVAQARERQRSSGPAVEADIFSAGALITAPGGHGTQYGLKITTISSPVQADQLVRERVAQGSDYIKIVLDSGRTYQSLPTVSDEMLRAVIGAAHRHGRPAIVHVGSSEEASRAVSAGADGLAHLFVDAPPAADLARQARRSGTFIIPTLVVMERIVNRFDRENLLRDERLSPYMTPSDAAALRRSFPVKSVVSTSMDHARQAIRQFRRAGVPILAGSDSGVAQGALLLRELELLVVAGLTPSEALKAATSNPAQQFGLEDRGRISPGRRADLILVNGDPTRDIAALRLIERVWRQGQPVDRQAFAQSLAAERAADDRLRAAPPPAGLENGLVSDFEDGTPRAAFGTGWSATSDQTAGGASIARIEVVEGGAQGSRRALQASGEIRPGFPFGFGGALFNPGGRPYAPTNLSGKTLSFWAKGDGQTYAVMVSARSYGTVPARMPFVAAPEWKRYSFPLSAFDGMEGHDITSILFSSGPRQGTFSFHLDDVRIE